MFWLQDEDVHKRIKEINRFLDGIYFESEVVEVVVNIACMKLHLYKKLRLVNVKLLVRSFANVPKKMIANVGMLKALYT